MKSLEQIYSEYEQFCKENTGNAALLESRRREVAAENYHIVDRFSFEDRLRDIMELYKM
jgi:hypothetical protein